jgi:hypothetical protein
MEKTKVVTICGSSRFIDMISVCGWLIEKKEGAIVCSLHMLPRWYFGEPDHQAEKEGVKDWMDTLHCRKIDISDEIFVVDYEGYVGESTRNEIQYATKKGVRVRYYSQDYIGGAVDEIIKVNNVFKKGG